MLSHHVGRGSVAVIGAGNADTLPLRRLTAAADHVDLVDVDRSAQRAARRRLGLRARERVSAIEYDITGGEANRVAAHAAGLAPSDVPSVQPPRWSELRYESVIGDR